MGIKGRKSILITGAASGIGRETALLFARKGWFVGLFDLDQEGLASLESEIGEQNVCRQRTDVTDAEQMRRSADRFAEVTGGRLDVLFNNAGIIRMGTNDRISISAQHQVVDVNIKGVLNGIHCALGYLRQTPGARIISMSSASAIYGIPEMAVYSATKHAVRALTESLDIELEPSGIAVSDILVPFVKTPLITDAPARAYSIDRMGVRITPARVAETVWKAAHGKKLHWKISPQLHTLLAIFQVFPFARRLIIKKLAMTPLPLNS
ncbi:short-chain dehydrogenase [Desulfonema ishimotonii]|uniref:Short-chain dehydrogenase n=1 Tax=Desulfonema ishimotonii TaxID=45657 RepID=A0A401FY15_9BACT|nr:SDR family oxidoreductase [Desulfonema ishimotonii]GBC61861.1 short-chain dehydrogenase [Desulfonema ishimotonii]